MLCNKRSEHSLGPKQELDAGWPQTGAGCRVRFVMITNNEHLVVVCSVNFTKCAMRGQQTFWASPKNPESYPASAGAAVCCTPAFPSKRNKQWTCSRNEHEASSPHVHIYTYICKQTTQPIKSPHIYVHVYIYIYLQTNDATSKILPTYTYIYI